MIKARCKWESGRVRLNKASSHAVVTLPPPQPARHDCRRAAAARPFRAQTSQPPQHPGFCQVTNPNFDKLAERYLPQRPSLSGWSRRRGSSAGSSDQGTELQTLELRRR